MLLLYAARLFRQCRKPHKPYTDSDLCFGSMLYLYALFAEYIHILCICAVYIRGTCSLSGGMCGLQHTERIHTAKTKRPGPFCEPSGPERVPGFVLSLCAGKGPARRAPCAAQQLFLRLGQLFERSFPPQGAALVRTALHVGKGRCTSGPGVAGPSAAFVGLQAGGRVGGPAGVQRGRRYTAPYTQRRALAGRTAQMRPLFFNT